MQLRDYQQAAKQGVYDSWGSGRLNTCLVMPTGAGKTATFSNIVHEHKGASVVIAHRNELVSQMSIALGREGVVHGIIAPEKTIKQICKEHVRTLGAVMFDGNSHIKVAGVNTLVRRQKELAQWANQVGLWITDEAHHIVRGNVWGKGIDMFPNAKGLGVTATPIRSDGKGLGRHADGVFDDLVEGPTMRELINRGFLSEYRIFAPPSNLDLSGVGLASDGDFKKPSLKKAVRESTIIGDIVTSYKKIAMGKLGITFVPDVETAIDVAAQYNASGVPAEVLSANTPADVRYAIIQRYRNREILQLVNVDILGEGFDLGNGVTVEVVSMARPTQSYGLYIQQFGRPIRPKEDGSAGIIIDHVGNIVRHGLPDKERLWSLDARDRSPKMKNPDDDIPLRYCVECTQPYEKVLSACPYCGTKHVPGMRTKPEYVDGDLFELSPEVLAQMRGEIDRIDEDPLRLIERMNYAHAPKVAIHGAVKNHKARHEAQTVLRDQISWYAAHHKKLGRDDPEIYKRFYFAFGTDVMSAQALGRREAEALALKISLNTKEIFYAPMA